MCTMCTSYQNGADASMIGNNAMCMKSQATGIANTFDYVCTPNPTKQPDGCPSDAVPCPSPALTGISTAECFDKKGAAKCAKKFRKGKCRKEKIKYKKCKLTCGGCS